MKKNQQYEKPGNSGSARIASAKLLTNRQFCERLGMSYEWGRKKIQRRQIAFVQIGRSVRIPEEEVDRFIDANLVPARRVQ